MSILITIFDLLSLFLHIFIHFFRHLLRVLVLTSNELIDVVESRLIPDQLLLFIILLILILNELKIKLDHV